MCTQISYIGICCFALLVLEFCDVFVKSAAEDVHFFL